MPSKTRNSLSLATSFSGHVNHETGEVNPDYREKVEAVIDALRTVGGFNVFCAVEHENWIIASESGSELAYFNQGAANLGRVRHVEYYSLTSLVVNMQYVLA